MPRTIRHDGPEDRCFGCGHSNPQGLRLVFQVQDDGEVLVDYEAPEHTAGMPGVVHGGVQAALLDEVIGMAILLHLEGPQQESGHVTADFQLRYRRPVPVAAPLRLHGRFLRREGRNAFGEGEIRSLEGELLTRGEARWVRLAPAGPSTRARRPAP